MNDNVRVINHGHSTKVLNPKPDKLAHRLQGIQAEKLKSISSHLSVSAVNSHHAPGNIGGELQCGLSGAVERANQAKCTRGPS